MDDLRPRGPAHRVLRTLAILSALGFLALVMVQAMAFYEPPAEAPKSRPQLLEPATKSAAGVHPAKPVYDLGADTKAGSIFPPTPLFEPNEPSEKRLLAPATKAGILGPLKLSPQAPAPQPQVAPLSRH